MEDRNLRANITQNELNILNGNKLAIFDLFKKTFFPDNLSNSVVDEQFNSGLMAISYKHEKDEEVPEFDLVVKIKKEEFYANK